VPIEVLDHPNPRNPARPAATVLLVRDGATGIEVLMIRRNASTAFGGMWAFPGGVIEAADVSGATDTLDAARRAAAREAREEVGLELEPSSFVFWSHWLPPDHDDRRFSTWFFVAAASDAHAVIGVDGLEVDDHRWFSPAAALAAREAGEIALAAPTMVSLVQLRDVASVDEVIGAAEPFYFATRFGMLADGTRVCLWAGDAGYESGDATASGAMHRLVMDDAGWRYLGGRGGTPVIETA
jgi:8-oxo-dGTP pyrophosphatase MutT (NUDIX family)